MKNLGVRLSNADLLQLKGGTGNCMRCLCGDEHFVYVDVEEFTSYFDACGPSGTGQCHLWDGPECSNIFGPG